jgi:hypothetical protein
MYRTHYVKVLENFIIFFSKVHKRWIQLKGTVPQKSVWDFDLGW